MIKPALTPIEIPLLIADQQSHMEKRDAKRSPKTRTMRNYIPLESLEFKEVSFYSFRIWVGWVSRETFTWKKKSEGDPSLP